jgi:hypothetical protein
MLLAERAQCPNLASHLLAESVQLERDAGGGKNLRVSG